MLSLVGRQLNNTGTQNLTNTHTHVHICVHEYLHTYVDIKIKYSGASVALKGFADSSVPFKFGGGFSFYLCYWVNGAKFMFSRKYFFFLIQPY